MCDGQEKEERLEGGKERKKTGCRGRGLGTKARPTPYHTRTLQNTRINDMPTLFSNGKDGPLTPPLHPFYYFFFNGKLVGERGRGLERGR